VILRADQEAVAELVPAGSRVLDVGCGDGALLEWLRDAKRVDARGIELSREGVELAVARGLSVVQGDADADLVDYPDGAFDVAVLSQTLQTVERPARVLAELLRIARRAIVSLPNFGYWRVRLALLTKGRMPVTRSLPVSWHETANIHLCTIKDFEALAAELGATIEAARFLGPQRPIRHAQRNWRAEQAVFMLARDGRRG
jgi:methionine biosynthesis protein MetW